MRSNKTVIIRVDGGICSQLSQYMLGVYFEERGFKVYYDLRWFYFDGKDLNGKKNRLFSIEQLIPQISISRPSLIRALLYSRKHSSDEMDLQILAESNKKLYLGGYYKLPLEMYKKMSRDLRIDPILDDNNRLWTERIKSETNAVAIHVRRGDMAEFSRTSYWKNMSVDYYFEAMRHFPNAVFYFFSDEIQWVKTHLVADNRMNNVDYYVVDANNESKGYLDLYLFSLFNSWICSEGSMGKLACVLSKQRNKHVILNKHSRWEEIFSYVGGIDVVVVDGYTN